MNFIFRKIEKAREKGDIPKDLYFPKYWRFSHLVLLKSKSRNQSGQMSIREDHFNVLVIEKMDSSLSDWMKNESRWRRPQRTAIVLHIFVQMMEIIKTLHELEIIHRDIKPANFLIKGEAMKM